LPLRVCEQRVRGATRGNLAEAREAKDREQIKAQENKGKRTKIGL
jgi:hypothetical protein